PYANYSTLPTWTPDQNIPSNTFSTALEVGSDNTITTSGTVTVTASAQGVVFETGTSITLNPGFSAAQGSFFTATLIPSTHTTCETPDPSWIQAYQSPTGCYNTTVQTQSQKQGVS